MASNKNKEVILVDSMGLVFRSYYAFMGRPLTTKEGIPTSAVFGFARSMIQLARRKPYSLIFTFDKGGPTFRNELYEDYKANRESPPDDLREQFPMVEEMVKEAGLPVMGRRGFEADDVIATLCRKARKKNLDVMIVTSDKDLFQLVEPGTTIFRGRTGEETIMDSQAVRDKIGVRPDQVRDYLTLVGDASDNVPGVPGIGAKTAAKLLGEYDSLDGIYKNLKDLKGKIKESLENTKKQAKLSKKLVTLRYDVPLKNIDFSPFEGFDLDRLRELFKRWEFGSLVKELDKLDSSKGPSSAGTSQKKTSPPIKEKSPANEKEVDGTVVLGEPDTKVTVAKTAADIKKIVAQFKKGRLTGVDTETTGIDPMQARLVGISLSFTKGKAWYIPLGHDEGNLKNPVQALKALAKPLGDSQIPKTGSNLKYDSLILGRAGAPLEGIASDTMIASYLLDSGFRRHGLKSLAAQHLGVQMQGIDELIGKGKKQITMAQVSVDRASPYAGADADMALRLALLLEKQLKKEKLWDLYTQIEIPLIPILAAMEKFGTTINGNYLKRLSKDLEKQSESLKVQIYKKAGKEFLVDSPKQLGQILFEHLGLPAKKKTKTGFSTDAEVLEDLSELHPVPALALEYRTLKKIKSTYADALPGQINPETGRIHTDYAQAVTATGRLSSTNPNLQNIPIRTELGRKIRRAFIPRNSQSMLLSLDYSQIELRILAHLSGDTNLIEAFEKGEDIHAQTASRIYGVSAQQVDQDMRRAAKVVNFGVLYGMSAFRLARQIHTSRSEAKDIIEKYFSTYPKVQEYFSEIVEEAKKTGEVRTMLGRRRHVPGLASHNAIEREAARRITVNTPIQGSAADLMKKAMIDVWNKNGGPDSGMMLQVHDELIFDLPKVKVDEMLNSVRRGMESAIAMRVPIRVDVKTGLNWADLEEHSEAS